VFEAVATEGTGLLQALSTISKKVIRALRGESLGSRAPLAPEPPAAPVRAQMPEPPAPLIPSPHEVMEEAILAEPEHPEELAIDAESQAAASALSDSPWERDEPDVLAAPPAARLGSSLTIVSVGVAVRVDDHSVRIPLVLGDDDGGTSSVVLTVRIDPLVGESGD
jgi:hypothetical protein